MDLVWAREAGDLIRGTLAGVRFELEGSESPLDLSFGGWGVSMNWYDRAPDSPATLDGHATVDGAAGVVCLSGTVPRGVERAIVTQGAEHTDVILIEAGPSGRRGWVGFAKDSQDDVRQMDLVMFDEHDRELARLGLVTVRPRLR